MPNIGEIRRGREIGKTGGRASGKYIWAACIDCGKERWVCLVKDNPRSLRCLSCAKAGERHPSWKAGRVIGGNGYIWIRLYPDDFFFRMARKNGYVPEHRLVMAKHLGRNLHRWELVHHKGTKYPIGSIENKSDNRIENLLIIVTGHKGNSGHTAKMVCPYCQKEFRVT